MIIPRADNNPLHAPLVPILQHLLTADSAPPATRLLDLACGAGDKLPLLRSAYGADAQIVGADIDPAPLRVFGSPLPPGEGPGV
ncbi:MAG: hypothetical protein H7Z42_13825, partial [Roseiflexaceae bacterium]|nr:hypothetical protein [Roseiflexaceae bacterium]